MFAPIVVMCLVAEPTRCNVFSAPMMETEEMCQVFVMTEGLPTLTNQYPDAYIAGIDCLEVDILDQAADAQ